MLPTPGRNRARPTTPVAPALRAGRPRRPPRRVGPRRGPVERLGLEGLLADVLAHGTAAVPVPAAQVPGSATGDGLTWAAPDRDDPAWWPQGVAALRGGGVLLVSWYEKASRAGRRGRRWRVPRSRVSVVDRSDPARPRYRHVELVVPRRRPLGWVLRPGRVPVHAGGVAVAGSPDEGLLLLVADTLSGLRVFRLDDLTRVAAPGPAGGARWVLPQRRSVRVPVLWGVLGDLRAGRRPDPLRFSFVGVGAVDGEPSLLAGEYRRAGAWTADGPPRLVRYRLQAATGLPAGLPAAVHVGQPPRMQGVAALPAPTGGTTWFLSASAGHDRCGDLHAGAPGSWRTVRAALPPGCEDLGPAGPAGPLWCASEHPGRRWVFPVEVAGLHGDRGGGAS